MNPGKRQTAVAAADEVLVQTDADQYRAVAVGGGGPTDSMTISRRGAGAVGSIYLGRVVRVVSGMKGAFVDIGFSRPAFLNFEKGVPAEGKSIVVQLVETDSAGKAPRVSTRIALEGRFLVLLPNGRGIATSRRLDKAERTRLAGVLEPRLDGDGAIVRAAASLAAPPALADELDILRRLWRDVATRLGGTPPLCAHEEHGIRRILCSFGAPGTKFVFADRDSMQMARSLAGTVAPGLADGIGFAEEGGALMDRYGVADVLAIAEGPEVPLPSGGRITIETTAALTAIDVDSGAGSSGADAGLATNLEAADAIGPQLRLRELGGPILIDFIRMARKGDHERVRRRLAQSVESDRMAVHLLGWTQGGLFELNRARAGSEG